MGVEIIPEDTTTILGVSRTSNLLELAAMDDLEGFKEAIEKKGHPIDELGQWYTRRIGSNKMSYEQRTPLMVAAQYGSLKVLDYILTTNLSNLSLTAGSDRVTALHCAVAGGSDVSPLVAERLISASSHHPTSFNSLADLIPCFPKFNKHQLETILNIKGDHFNHPPQSPEKRVPSPSPSPSDMLPDINNGVYSSDEFRMYCFKIVPCSRAYTHDWTECPFAHPGENAKRRDPKKHQYTCVPCPEFKKGSCKKGDDCEFAHGVFESWLHPAQYRTRLCKDEIGCNRKVCFFAHKKEELRPVYQSTGSAIPGLDMGTSGMGSSGLSTPPLSPSFSPKSGGGGGVANGWSGKGNLGGSPPSLQLPGSRLRASFSARDVDLQRELMKIEKQFLQQQQQIHSPRWSEMSPVANLDTVFSSINVPRKLSPPRNLESSPKSVAAAMLNSRAAAFAKRSQSFIDRSGGGSPIGYGGSSGANLWSAMSGNMSDWGSPNGRLDWGVQGGELNKLRKSNSFGLRGTTAVAAHSPERTSSPPGFHEPDVSWVNSLVKDETNVRYMGTRAGGGNGGGAGNGIQPWIEQLYIEQEQLMA